jgi:hypothetical protein
MRGGGGGDGGGGVGYGGQFSSCSLEWHNCFG